MMTYDELVTMNKRLVKKLSYLSNERREEALTKLEEFKRTFLFVKIQLQGYNMANLDTIAYTLLMFEIFHLFDSTIKEIERYYLK